MGLPYAAIGIGVTILVGIWAFVVADTLRARTFIAGGAVLVVLTGAIFRSQVGQLLAFAAWVAFGIGCIIYLRLKGLEIR